MADVSITACNVARSWHWFRQVTAPCNVACGSGIMTMNSPCGSTLQCGRWLWNDMPRNSPKRPPCWNSTSGFDFGVSLQSACHSAAVCEISSKLDHPQPKKMMLCRFSKWRMSAILDFRGPIMGSLKSRCTTFYRSWIATIDLNCLVFEKIAFFCILATNKQTDKQMDSIDALSRSRYRERRLKNCWNKENWRSTPCPTKEYTTNAVQQISQIFIRDAIKLEWQD